MITGVDIFWNFESGCLDNHMTTTTRNTGLVCVMLDKNFSFQVNVFLRKHFYKYSSRKFKKGVVGKILKYGGNKKNHIFTIDNTNALKKSFTIHEFFFSISLSKNYAFRLKGFSEHYVLGK